MGVVRTVGIQADIAVRRQIMWCIWSNTGARIWEIANQGIHGVESRSMWFGHEWEWKERH